MQRKLLVTAILCAIAPLAAAEEMDLGTLVVTAPEMQDPLTVVTDPKAPVQPVPAADGAAYLKNIPGFSMIRKGGTSGDPVFRGEAASRLNILADGEHIFGGCGMRMDPPTAYTYPASYDRVVVLKGPQSVRYGVSEAGTVLFERDPVRFTQPTTRGEASLLAGSFGRYDEVVDVTSGNSTGALRGIITRSESDDYKDGDGNLVHSRYQRWSGTLSGTWNVTEDTQAELTVDRSDANAAYADRIMDGSKFDRTGYGVKITSKNVSQLIEKVEVTAFDNYVDHVMDNYSLRRLADPTKAAYNNPDRHTTGARLAAQLGFGEKTFAWVGVDQQSDKHTLRAGSGLTALDGPSGPRNDDASFDHLGAFAELNHDFTARDRVVTGIRTDWEKATAKKAAMPFYGGAPTGTEDKDTNTSGFGRWEHQLAETPMTVYAGYGVAVRSPDYWEREKVFNLSQEHAGEADLGVSYRTDRLRWTVSAFHTRFKDYILVTNTGVNAMGVPTSTARNIDALTYGGEADLNYRLADHWTTTGTFAYVRGENETDNKPLAQMPAVQTTLGLNYADDTWSYGVLARVAEKQDRVDVGSGNVVGQDIGPTPGFTVWSVNGGYKVRKNVTLTAGIDNIFNVTYAEAISRGGAAVSGFEQTTRVNEPGRNYWLRASMKFD